MDNIKIYKKVNTIKPVMIAGWPGMGNVALGVVDYLKRHLETTRFAEILVDQTTALDSVVVEDGLAKLAQPPKNTFYYAKDLDLIIFEGEAQLAGPVGISLLNNVLELASELKVPRIYTGAAFPMPISHKEHSDVYTAVNEERLKGAMTKFGVKLMEGGHISGLNGLLLGFAQKKGIEALCLLATIPQYAISIPNPKASWAIIDLLGKELNFQVDLLELSGYIKDMDEKMAMIEDKVKDVFAIGEEPQKPRQAEKKIPDYIMERIEKLFQEAKIDKKKAMTLKKELDRWDLFKLYEDRFLDLFKDTQ
jgi:uncharacterized protein